MAGWPFYLGGDMDEIFVYLILGMLGLIVGLLLGRH